MTKFIHIRIVKDEEGTVDEKGGVTIAYSFDPNTRRAYYALSRCSVRDNYCKKIGRAIALGRLNTTTAVAAVTIPEGERVANFIVHNEGF